MIKLIYACADKGTRVNIISIYSTDEQSVVELIDSILSGVNIQFVDAEGCVLGNVSQDDFTCSDGIEGYHEPEDDLMIDILEGDPDFNEIDIYCMEVNLDEAKSKEVINRLQSAANSIGVEFIKD